MAAWASDASTLIIAYTSPRPERPSGHKDIRWLDVAMSDPFLVRGVQSVGDLYGNVQQFIDL